MSYNMKNHDGVRLACQFYANHGQLRLVELKTGVSVKRIENFLENDILSESDRDKLSAPLSNPPKGYA